MSVVLEEIIEKIKAKKLKKETQILKWLEDHDYPTFSEITMRNRRSDVDCDLCGKRGLRTIVTFTNKNGEDFALGKNCAAMVSFGVHEEFLIKALKDSERTYLESMNMLNRLGTDPILKAEFMERSGSDVWLTHLTTRYGRQPKPRRLHERFLNSFKAGVDLGIYKETETNVFELNGWNGLTLDDVKSGITFDAVAIDCGLCGIIELREKFEIKDGIVKCPSCGETFFRAELVERI